VETAAVLPFFLNESTEAWAVLMATSFLAQSRLYPKRYFDSIADSILVNQLYGQIFFAIFPKLSPLLYSLSLTSASATNSLIHGICFRNY
jgi:hypothetical protein